MAGAALDKVVVAAPPVPAGQPAAFDWLTFSSLRAIGYVQ